LTTDPEGKEELQKMAGEAKYEATKEAYRAERDLNEAKEEIGDIDFGEVAEVLGSLGVNVPAADLESETKLVLEDVDKVMHDESLQHELEN